MSIEQNARCEQEPMACRESASFVGIEGDLSYGDMVLGGETLQDRFCVVAQVARGLRQEQNVCHGVALARSVRSRSTGTNIV